MKSSECFDIALIVFERWRRRVAPAMTACDLIRGIHAAKILVDCAYDADSLHDLIYSQGGEPVIPLRRHRKYQHRYDRIAYQQ